MSCLLGVWQCVRKRASSRITHYDPSEAGAAYVHDDTMPPAEDADPTPHAWRAPAGKKRSDVHDSTPPLSASLNGAGGGDELQRGGQVSATDRWERFTRLLLAAAVDTAAEHATVAHEQGGDSFLLQVTPAARGRMRLPPLECTSHHAANEAASPDGHSKEASPSSPPRMRSLPTRSPLSVDSMAAAREEVARSAAAMTAAKLAVEVAMSTDQEAAAAAEVARAAEAMTAAKLAVEMAVGADQEAERSAMASGGARARAHRAAAVAVAAAAAADSTDDEEDNAPGGDTRVHERDIGWAGPGRVHTDGDALYMGPRRAAELSTEPPGMDHQPDQRTSAPDWHASSADGARSPSSPMPLVGVTVGGALGGALEAVRRDGAAASKSKPARRQKTSSARQRALTFTSRFGGLRPARVRVDPNAQGGADAHPDEPTPSTTVHEEEPSAQIAAAVESAGRGDARMASESSTGGDATLKMAADVVVSVEAAEGAADDGSALGKGRGMSPPESAPKDEPSHSGDPAEYAEYDSAPPYPEPSSPRSLEYEDADRSASSSSLASPRNTAGAAETQVANVDTTGDDATDATYDRDSNEQAQAQAQMQPPAEPEPEPEAEEEGEESEWSEPESEDEAAHEAAENESSAHSPPPSRTPQPPAYDEDEDEDLDALLDELFAPPPSMPTTPARAAPTAARTPPPAAAAAAIAAARAPPPPVRGAPALSPRTPAAERETDDEAFDDGMEEVANDQTRLAAPGRTRRPPPPGAWMHTRSAAAPSSSVSREMSSNVPPPAAQPASAAAATAAAAPTAGRRLRREVSEARLLRPAYALTAGDDAAEGHDPSPRGGTLAPVAAPAGAGPKAGMTAVRSQPMLPLRPQSAGVQVQHARPAPTAPSAAVPSQRPATAAASRPTHGQEMARGLPPAAAAAATRPMPPSMAPARAGPAELIDLRATQQSRKQRQ